MLILSSFGVIASKVTCAPVRVGACCLTHVADRRVHLPSGRVYHLKFSPPKVPDVDDLTGEPVRVPLVSRPAR